MRRSQGQRAAGGDGARGGGGGSLAAAAHARGRPTAKSSRSDWQPLPRQIMKIGPKSTMFFKYSLWVARWLSLSWNENCLSAPSLRQGVGETGSGKKTHSKASESVNHSNVAEPGMS